MVKRILVVDDEFDVRKLLTFALKKCQYEVLAVADGNSAVEQIGAFRPDVVLLDLKLPDIDGYEVFSRFKSNPATAQVPVIFITAYTAYGNENVTDKTGRIGAAGCLLKPFEFSALRAKLEAVLSPN